MNVEREKNVCKYAFFYSMLCRVFINIFFSLWNACIHVEKLTIWLWFRVQIAMEKERKTIKNCKKKSSHRKRHYLLLLQFSCNKYKIVWVVLHSCVRRNTSTILAVCILYIFRMPPISVSGNNNMYTRRNTTLLNQTKVWCFWWQNSIKKISTSIGTKFTIISNLSLNYKF